MATLRSSVKNFYNTYLRDRLATRKKKKKLSTDVVDMTVGMVTPETVFREFCREPNFQNVLIKFEGLRRVMQLTPEAGSIYSTCRGRINLSEARTLWRNLDKRVASSAYKDGKACSGKTVLIVGAGPCGLRMAIEAALLGMRTVVVEMRSYITRNNVLHLWPFVIADLKALGARVFNNKFCCGSREHASIRAVQQMLLKVALVLGVEVYSPVKFDALMEPDNQGVGWRARFSVLEEDGERRAVLSEKLSQLEFDVLIGADGKRNTLIDFNRKQFRGKLAIAVTANFVNENTAADNAVEEIGGLFYVFNQPFFDGLRDRAGIELENFVYFKDDTHYFVMTARKQSLLKKGVLKQDFSDTQQLLSPTNIDRHLLLSYARDTAILSTDGQLADPQFACDHQNREDVAIFDFTNLHQAEHACLIKERQGRQLVEAIVGDTLIEPFWPTGSGCARGFLSVFDAAWMMRNLFSGECSPLEAIAEREAVLQLLSQTKPDNLNMRLTEYTLDPRTRYGPKFGRIKRLSSEQVQHLYDRGLGGPTVLPTKPKPMPRKPRTPAYDGTLNRKRLLEWYKKRLEPLSNLVNVRDLTSSWRNGLALLSLLHLYRPGLLDVRYVSPDNAVNNIQRAFDLIFEHFGVEATLSAELLASGGSSDRLAILSYLTQLQQELEKETPATVVEPAEKKPKRSSLARKFSSAAMLARLAQRTVKRVKISQPQVPEKRMKLARTRQRMERLSRSATLDKCKGIAAKRIQALQQAMNNEPDKPDGKPPVSPPGVTSDKCCICHHRLYVSQRQNARGFFFHRSCFHCMICDAQLWMHSFHDAQDSDGQVYFLCPLHAPVEEKVEEAAAQAEAPDMPGEPETMDEVQKDEVDTMTLEEMAQMVSPEMMMGGSPCTVSQAMGGMMGGMMGGSPAMQGVPHSMLSRAMGGMAAMASAFTASAVAEEDESDDELTEDTQQMDLSSPDAPAAAAPPGGESGTETRRRARYYTLATSMRLMVGHEIQQEYEQMETEERELETQGVQMEENLRHRQSVIDPNSEESSNEALVEKWMDVVRRKQDVHNKQNKLALRAKLLELQERHQRLQRQLQKICQLDDFEEDIDALSALTDNLSDEVNDTVKQILELRMFLATPGESQA